MACIGNLEAQSGVVATYHIVGRYVWNKSNGLDVIVWSFLDRDARISDKQPVTISTYSFGKESYLNKVTEEGSITLQAVYELLADIPPFNQMQSDEA